MYEKEMQMLKIKCTNAYYTLKYFDLQDVYH